MRTKALLGLAALVAGVFSAAAQGNVYSLNVVGYVNLQVPTGYSLIANPLNSADNTVSNLFNAANPLGSTVYSWNGTFFVANPLDEFGSGWQFPADQYPPGKGFFIKNPNAPFTVTFVGEVLQGNLAVTLPAVGGYGLVSSKVPEAGFVADLGLSAAPGDTIYLWNGSFFVAIPNDEFGGGWAASAGFNIDTVKGPFLDIAKSFFFKNQMGTATWVRNFTVQ